MLAPSGVLVLECPDFARNIAGVLAGNERSMGSIFGWQRYPGDTHHWGYTPEMLSKLVKETGFSSTSTPLVQDYHTASEPCIRVEVTK